LALRSLSIARDGSADRDRAALGFLAAARGVIAERVTEALFGPSPSGAAATAGVCQLGVHREAPLPEDLDGEAPPELDLARGNLDLEGSGRAANGRGEDPLGYRLPFV